MRKSPWVIILGIVFLAGIYFFVAPLPGGLSIAQATPRMGNNCAACHTTRGSSKTSTSSFDLDKCDGFSSTGRNPYFILETGYQMIFEGREKRHNAQLTITVLNETRIIHIIIAGTPADVETRVVEERLTHDGVLAELSRNYFSICNRTNSVFYFGEAVESYDPDGTTVISTEGSWEAGISGAQPGVIMPGTVLLGGKYFQEIAPGVAMDRAEIVSLSEIVNTPEQTFTDCLKTAETSPLVRGKEFKYYARDVGLVRDGNLKLKQHGFLP